VHVGANEPVVPEIVAVVGLPNEQEPVAVKVIVFELIPALEASLSVNVPEVDRVFPHLISEMEFRFNVVACLFTS